MKLLSVFLSLSIFPSEAMGVLMSKKQQLEKVQKCNAVVSAFQSGIKDRPAPAKQADGEIEEDEAPAKSSASPEEKNAEVADEGETDNSAGPSTSQQASTSAKDECKINQEAWSRLRDGKGVEPEDLDKSHQLTPPAFVRPKREADDDQPLEVELEKKEQVLNDCLRQHIKKWLVIWCDVLSFKSKIYIKKKKLLDDEAHYKTTSPWIKKMSLRYQRISMATAANYLFSSFKLSIMIKQFIQALKGLSSFI